MEDPERGRGGIARNWRGFDGEKEGQKAQMGKDVRKDEGGERKEVREREEVTGGV